jgi:hypothetical protein
MVLGISMEVRDGDGSAPASKAATPGGSLAGVSTRRGALAAESLALIAGVGTW